MKGLFNILAAAGLLLWCTPVRAQALPSFADLVEKLQPSVVNISTTHKPQEDSSNEEMLGIESTNPRIKDYFNPQNPQQLSLGSGFIIDGDGYIITNNHVIDQAEEITVTLADNRQLTARLVGRDGKTDIALIKVEASEKLPAVKLGDSDKIRVGDWVLAIGNPFGLGAALPPALFPPNHAILRPGLMTTLSRRMPRLTRAARADRCLTWTGRSSVSILLFFRLTAAVWALVLLCR